MNEACKLSVAMEMIENKIAQSMIKMRETKDSKEEENYKNLIKTREEIYKGNMNEINKIIKEGKK